MQYLTTDNASGWLRRHGQLLPDEPAQIRELADGVSNAVLRVETPRRTFVLKQSRPQLRTHVAWFSNIDRIWRERTVMQLLRPLLPDLVVPEVWFSVEEDYVFAMSHAPEPNHNWRTLLLTGEVDPDWGNRAGRLLGAIHDATARRLDALTPCADRTVFEQLRVEPFYLAILARHRDLTSQIQPLLERMRTVRQALCHGDFSPKNLLVHANGFTLVDYETGHWGDPAMDLGFFLSHILLKAVQLPDKVDAYFALTRAFWAGYAATQQTLPFAELQEAGFGHLAACLLARVDGTSPAPYLTDPMKRETVRHMARALFHAMPTAWEDVLLHVRQKMAVANGVRP